MLFGKKPGEKEPWLYSQHFGPELVEHRVTRPGAEVGARDGALAAQGVAGREQELGELVRPCVTSGESNMTSPATHWL